MFLSKIGKKKQIFVICLEAEFTIAYVQALNLKPNDQGLKNLYKFI